MQRPRRLQNLIIVPLLIISLVVFNSPVFVVLAEEPDSPPDTGGVSEEGGVEEDTEGMEEGSGGEDGGDLSDGSEKPEELGGSEEGDDSSADATVDTGDVDASIEIENDVNTNTFEDEGEPESCEEEEPLSDEEGGDGEEEGVGEEEGTGGEEGGEPEGLEGEEPQDDSPQEGQGEEEGEGEEGGEEEVEGGEEAGQSNEEDGCLEEGCLVTVVNENEAAVENDLEEQGVSGENEAGSNQGDAIINTGNVNLVVGVANTVNTNITGSDFSQFLLNIFEELEGDIDWSAEIGTSSEYGCLSEECSFNIFNENQGSIENEILVDGSSGGNLAESLGGDAVINTGDANVSTNIFNTLNSNIIGSNWTQFIINIFDGWAGDLILPGKEIMEQFLIQDPWGCGGGCGGLHIFNSNEGEIENEIDIQADTGENEAQGSPAIIRTGRARAETNIFNFANTNITGSNWLFIAVNNFGQWEGNIYSLPPGFEIIEDSGGIKIYNLEPEDLGDNSINYQPSANGLNVINNNSGFIRNSVIINVSTGQNSAVSEGGSAIINTGDANVLTNLINILNSNLTGNNFLTGMVNVFGTWEGDLAFGRPDLWIGASATANPAPAQIGAIITYTLTYTNNGDADATGVTIVDDFDERYLLVNNPGGGTLIGNPGEIRWDIGTVPVGGSGSVSYSVIVDFETPRDVSHIISHSTIDSFEDDWSDGDNSDSLAIELYWPPDAGLLRPVPPKLEIRKTSDGDGSVYSSSTVNYTITLINDSVSFAYDVVVNDVLVNEASEVINTFSWDLGEVFPYEEVIINYTVVIDSGAQAGFYTNTAQATGLDKEGNPISSPEASWTIELIEEEPPPAGDGEDGVGDVGGGEEEEEKGGPSLEEIGNGLEEIEVQVKKIKEEIERRIREAEPEAPPEEAEPSFPEVFIPRVSAREEIELPPEGGEPERKPPLSEAIEFLRTFKDDLTSNLTSLLAAIGMIAKEIGQSVWGIIILLLLLAILAFLSTKKRKKEPRG